MVIKIEYGSPWIDNEGNVKLKNFELKTNEDLRVMWNTFDRYEKKGLIEVDVTVVRSLGDIIKKLKHLESSSNV